MTQNRRAISTYFLHKQNEEFQREVQGGNLTFSHSDQRPGNKTNIHGDDENIVLIYAFEGG